MRRADIAWTPEDMPCSAAWHWKFKVLAMPTLATHAVPSRPTITLSAKLSTFCDAMPPITGSACFMTISTRSCLTPSTPSVTPKARRRRLEEGGASTEEIDDETSDVVASSSTPTGRSSDSSAANDGTDAASARCSRLSRRRATIPRRAIRESRGKARASRSSPPNPVRENPVFVDAGLMHALRVVRGREEDVARPVGGANRSRAPEALAISIAP
jgi:hypothetical protein